MGSLMSGWDSKSVTYKRNRSLTKEEIEAYWRSKNKTIEEHLQEITSSSDAQKHQDQVSKLILEESGNKFQRSSSLPLDNRKHGLVADVDDETSIEKLIKKHGWWTKSNWAFLNEPPPSEGAPNTYVSQFHVANLAPSKSEAHDGIATN